MCHLESAVKLQEAVRSSTGEVAGLLELTIRELHGRVMELAEEDGDATEKTQPEQWVMNGLSTPAGEHAMRQVQLALQGKEAGVLAGIAMAALLKEEAGSSRRYQATESQPEDTPLSRGEELARWMAVRVCCVNPSATAGALLRLAGEAKHSEATECSRSKLFWVAQSAMGRSEAFASSFGRAALAFLGRLEAAAQAAAAGGEQEVSVAEDEVEMALEAMCGCQPWMTPALMAEATAKISSVLQAAAEGVPVRLNVTQRAGGPPVRGDGQAKREEAALKQRLRAAAAGVPQLPQRLLLLLPQACELLEASAGFAGRLQPAAAAVLDVLVEWLEQVVLPERMLGGAGAAADASDALFAAAPALFASVAKLLVQHAAPGASGRGVALRPQRRLLQLALLLARPAQQGLLLQAVARAAAQAAAAAAAPAEELLVEDMLLPAGCLAAAARGEACPARRMVAGLLCDVEASLQQLAQLARQRAPRAPPQCRAVLAGCRLLQAVVRREQQSHFAAAAAAALSGPCQLQALLAWHAAFRAAQALLGAGADDASTAAPALDCLLLCQQLLRRALQGGSVGERRLSVALVGCMAECAAASYSGEPAACRLRQGALLQLQACLLAQARSSWTACVLAVEALLNSGFHAAVRAWPAAAAAAAAETPVGTAVRSPQLVQRSLQLLAPATVPTPSGRTVPCAGAAAVEEEKGKEAAGDAQQQLLGCLRHLLQGLQAEAPGGVQRTAWQEQQQQRELGVDDSRSAAVARLLARLLSQRLQDGLGPIASQASYEDSLPKRQLPHWQAHLQVVDVLRSCPFLLDAVLLSVQHGGAAAAAAAAAPLRALLADRILLFTSPAQAKRASPLLPREDWILAVLGHAGWLPHGLQRCVEWSWVLCPAEQGQLARCLWHCLHAGCAAQESASAAPATLTPPAADLPPAAAPPGDASLSAAPGSRGEATEPGIGLSDWRPLLLAMLHAHIAELADMYGPWRESLQAIAPAN